MSFITGERFSLDTNILVYSLDSTAGLRHRISARIIERAPRSKCFLALQAFSEFYAVVTRKGMMPSSEARDQCEDWLELFPVALPSIQTLRTALATASSGRVSYWDALLVATVAEAGCTALLTKDMANGATLLGVRILNPFDAEGLTKEAESLLLR